MRYDIVNFTDFDLDQFFGTSDDTSLLMTLIWILPVIIFVFYGQRIQLQITSGEIKKSIKKLGIYKDESRHELLKYIQNNYSGGRNNNNNNDQSFVSEVGSGDSDNNNNDVSGINTRQDKNTVFGDATNVTAAKAETTSLNTSKSTLGTNTTTSQNSSSQDLLITQQVDQLLDYFTIPPVDLDPNGIIPKIKRVIRDREDYTRANIARILVDVKERGELDKIQTLLEIATSLRLLYKIINHLFLTAKKQNNYPLILPLQMMLPFVMEEASALRGAISAFENNQPIGDSIGPIVVGKMMLGAPKKEIAFETVMGSTTYRDNKTLLLVKARGPSSTVGRPADGLKRILEGGGNGGDKTIIDAIVMVDAALKFEGEDSASISQGFGAAIGGVQTERFEIEQMALEHNIPIFSIVIKQSVREAITLMTWDIAQQADEARRRVYQIIDNDTKPGDTILVIGVGNTVGVPQ